MAKEIRIEQLEASDKTDVLEVLTQAFKDIPSPRLETKPKIMRILMSTIQRLFGEKIGMRAKLYLFGGFANSPSYGIRKDGKLVCAAILADYTARPKLPILSRIVLWPIGFLIFLVFRVGRIFRWRTAIELERLSKEMPGYYKGRYLELVIFGTLPAYQKQGFGREMLRFICKRAESEGYEGIRLVTTRDTPAFHLYIKEGFTVEKDLNIASENVVLMQLAFFENPSPTAYNSG
ncbi:GNAT family N-acetyltransferase [Dehalococcoidia bacterium]|nr:GNAT family N-acetyltransferase [Dehalococcoidia bacterium]